MTTGAGATTGAGFPSGQANVAVPTPGQPGTGAGGEQAAVGAVGERLAMQPMLPPAAAAAAAIPADAAAPGAPADQPANPKKRSRKSRNLDETGTLSLVSASISWLTTVCQIHVAVQSTASCGDTRLLAPSIHVL